MNIQVTKPFAAEKLILKPCPHCGTRRPTLHARTSWVEVHCTGCGAKGPSGLNAEQAAERWNWRRKPKPGVD